MPPSRDRSARHDPDRVRPRPAVAGVRNLLDDHEVAHDQIEHVEIVTFHEASRLATAAPSTTEEAQYSLAWPVAAAIVRGRVGVHEISGPSLADRGILRLSTTTLITESDEFNSALPARRFARVVLVLRDGSRLASGPTEAGGDPEHPPSDGELGRKYRSLTHEVIGTDRAAALADEIDSIDQDRPLDSYVGLRVEPPPPPSELERSYSAGGRIR
ncbi:MAG: MmgE/PrpD family protein [Actinomycetia bacterium]|nr:MmgE/PrpD family protein [Actinomycetes bacterium]